MLCSRWLFVFVSQRICLGGGLNEGQQNTLDRNAKVLQQLQDEIEELEDTIRTRNAQREGTQRAQEVMLRSGG